ncbi:DNA-binding response regulator [Streptomyces sp. NPDC004111]|uniref:DNA-binding response regulator n=1 Tax=Streptomyces sp. NPDC004111 TaxID=3364690 RepID=UPI0036B16FD2
MHFDAPEGVFSVFGALRTGRFGIDFATEAELTTTADPLDLPILVPVVSEFQAERIRAVRARHPLSLITAVTDDVTGHRTYGAIKSGANAVLNLAIPGERQIEMLVAQFHAHLEPRPVLSQVPSQTPRTGPAHGRGRPPQPQAGQPGQPLDTELMRLLCTPMTVAEIARRHYCSERSMYRRIRQLYDEVGVRGRTELMAKVALPA